SPSAATADPASAPEEKADPFGKYPETLEISVIYDRNPETEKSFIPGSSYETNWNSDFWLEKLNIKPVVKWSAPAGDQYNQKYNLMFASNDLPDIFLLRSTDNKQSARSMLKKLVDADMVEDLTAVYSQYASDEVKDYYQTFDNKALDYATFDGKMYGLPSQGDTYANVQILWVRQDWLDKLSLQAPRTIDDLVTVARAFKEKDPDGNGKADTWFMGAAGAGQGWGMMAGLIDMFGHRSWNVKDGKINHPMLDGTTKAFLEYAKKLNDNKLLAPDWYTIQWEQFKSYTLQNKIGMVNYPGWNLLQEQYSASQNNADTMKNWAPIPPLTSDMNAEGKLGPGGTPGGIIIVSKKVGDDPGKMKRIAHFLDAVQYPNKYYWVGNQGGGPEIWPDYTKVTKNDDGTYFYDSDMVKLQNEMKPELKGMMDWQSVGYTLIWERHKYSAEFPYNEPGDKYQDEVRAYPRVTNYDMLLNLDGPTTNRLQDFVQKNEISFVLGKRSFDDWDQYVEEWKKAGGQMLIDQAAGQLGVEKP
ncbi:extracellular solute-binding protein, partial [Paenibacillus sepulcri]|nr:extracellular solute-binding protein [Paenibacillus sepulcri]